MRIKANLFQRMIVHLVYEYVRGFELFSALWEAQTLRTGRAERPTKAWHAPVDMFGKQYLSHLLTVFGPQAKRRQTFVHVLTPY
jgi:hypothetical protein